MRETFTPTSSPNRELVTGDTRKGEMTNYTIEEYTKR
jgi:hypothetical protein